MELGRRLLAFRAQHGLTQAEVAAVVGAGTPTSVTQWESGARVPEGGRRQRVEALVGGQLWPELRSAVVAGTGMPARWATAVRWYRRASRERARRTREGTAIASILEDLRDTQRLDVLRQRYAAAGAGWAHGWTRGAAPTPGDVHTHGPGGAVLRQIEDASFGLRWLEIARGGRLDLSRSLLHQLDDGHSATRGTRALTIPPGPNAVLAET